jgi:hypothetical protein
LSFLVGNKLKPKNKPLLAVVVIFKKSRRLYRVDDDMIFSDFNMIRKLNTDWADWADLH